MEPLGGFFSYLTALLFVFQTNYELKQIVLLLMLLFNYSLINLSVNHAKTDYYCTDSCLTANLSL